MKYIEISNGLSVKMDEIEAISQGTNELTSIIHTHHNTYDSTFPYSVLLELLEREQKENTEIKDILQKQLNIQKEIGVFAG